MKLKLILSLLILPFLMASQTYSQDSLNIQKLASLYNHPYSVGNLHFESGLLYNAQRDSGFKVIDVQNPANPSEIGSFHAETRLYSATIFDTIAYLNCYDSALTILNITNPDEIRQVSSYDVGESIYGMSIKDSLLFIGSRLGVHILSLNDPLNPIEIGFYSAEITPFFVFVFGNLAYAVSVITDVVVLDVSDPVHPMEIATIATPGQGSKLTMAGDLLFIAEKQNGMKVYNMIDPSHPELLETYNTNGRCFDVKVSGSLAYIADDAEGLRILDISNIDLDEIVEVGFYKTTEDALALELGEDGVVFVHERNSLGIYRFDPTQVISPVGPILPGSFSLSSFPSPFNSSTIVSFSSPFAGAARASLVDISGREIQTWIASRPSAPAFAGMENRVGFGNSRFVVDGAGLSAGTYWLRVEQGGHVASTRLVLVR